MRGEIAGRYVIRRVIGSGPGTIVHEAFDRLIERRVAIKLVSLPPAEEPETAAAVARFRQGARAAGRLNHPNIVAVFDYGEDAERAWIVMELVEGGTLKDVMDRERLPAARVVALMGQVLDALAYSHAMGVVHRDIKPANIMLTQAGTVKIADFGIAKLENSAVTHTGTLLGTPAYMAPEQFRGERVDHRADIWAAGAVLYQMLTGERPFAGSVASIMHKALTLDPDPPSRRGAPVPPGSAFDDIVAKALAKFPEDRFVSASEFASALREAAVSSIPGLRHPLGPMRLREDATLVTRATELPIPGAETMPGLDEFDRPRPPPLSDWPRTAPPAHAPRPRRTGLLFALAGVLALLLGAAGLAFVAGPPRDAPGQEAALRQPEATEATERGDSGGSRAEPEPVQPAAAPNLDAAAGTVTASVACGLVSARANEGVLQVAGVLRRGEEATLRTMLESFRIPPDMLRLAVEPFDGPYCPALDAARLDVAPPDAGPQVTMLSPNPLPVGRRLRFQVRAPSGWPSVHLAIAYMTVEGFVAHIVGVEMAPGTTVTFADPQWQAMEPAGTDLMLVIASDRPIFAPRGERPRVERVAEFAPALALALREAREAGAHTAVRPIALRIAAR